MRMILFGRVLWHINHCRLLMPIPLYTYIFDILKIDLVSYPARVEGLVNSINHYKLFYDNFFFYL